MKEDEELVWSKEVEWAEKHKATFQDQSNLFQALRTVTPDFLPVAASDQLFHLRFLLFKWIEITARNIDGPVYGNDRAGY